MERSKKRWQHYILKKNSKFDDFWISHMAQEKNLLYILGSSFDPRMCLGIKKIIENLNNSKLTCHLIEYNNQTNQRLSRHRNNDELERIVRESQIKKENKLIQNDNIFKGARMITKIYDNINDFNSYTDIIIDISALPVNLYFPLIGRVLKILDNVSAKKLSIPNLHVLVAENQEIDQSIKESELIRNAYYIFSFASELGKENNQKRHVWIPTLGENSNTQLKRIRTFVKPIEVCPLVPSLSKDPKRGDKIMLEYNEFFQKTGIEMRNVIYGAEQNPFEAYRQIIDTIDQYHEILKSQGGCNIALSAITSKLLSLAALLVAYERDTKDLSIGIAHISGTNYRIDYENMKKEVLDKTELFSLCLAGTYYDC